MKHTKPFMGKQALSFEDKVVFTRAILCLCVCVCVCVCVSPLAGPWRQTIKDFEYALKSTLRVRNAYAF